jgi:hypothetical protein
MSTEHNETLDLQEGDYTITQVESSQGNLATIIGTEIDVQIRTAKAFPRSLAKFKAQALALATINQEVAESCEYSLPRGRDEIKGPSVRLAEIVVMSYQNIRAGARVVANTGRSITAQGICFDLENNVAITIEVTRSIMQNEYKYDRELKKRVRTGKLVPMSEDLQTLVANAACKIAFRNAVFTVVPRPAWDEVYQETKLVALGSETTLVDRRNKAIDFFVKRGVKEEQIYRKLEVAGREDVTLEKLATLSRFKTSLKQEGHNLESLFAVEEPPADPGATATSAALKKIKEGLRNRKDGKGAADAATEGLAQGLAGDENPQ